MLTLSVHYETLTSSWPLKREHILWNSYCSPVNVFVLLSFGIRKYIKVPCCMKNEKVSDLFLSRKTFTLNTESVHPNQYAVSMDGISHSVRLCAENNFAESVSISNNETESLYRLRSRAQQ